MLEEMKVKWNRRDSLSEEFVFRRFVRSSDNDPHKVLRQDERHPLSVDSKLLLLVVQEMTKVYMKYLRKQIYYNWMTFCSGLQRTKYNFIVRNVK